MRHSLSHGHSPQPQATQSGSRVLLFIVVSRMMPHLDANYHAICACCSPLAACWPESIESQESRQSGAGLR
eukprot:9967817-Alexandrium_andersonii.AAC.1